MKQRVCMPWRCVLWFVDCSPTNAAWTDGSPPTRVGGNAVMWLQKVGFPIRVVVVLFITGASASRYFWDVT